MEASFFHLLRPKSSLKLSLTPLFLYLSPVSKSFWLYLQNIYRMYCNYLPSSLPMVKGITISQLDYPKSLQTGLPVSFLALSPSLILSSVLLWVILKYSYSDEVSPALQKVHIVCYKALFNLAFCYFFTFIFNLATATFLLFLKHTRYASASVPLHIFF